MLVGVLVAASSAGGTSSLQFPDDHPLAAQATQDTGLECRKALSNNVCRTAQVRTRLWKG